MHAVVKGKESTHRHNQWRKKGEDPRIEDQGVPSQVLLPRNNVRLLSTLSTVRILPDFVCDDMPLLPDGEMPPLNYSSESVFMYALIAMPTLYEFN